MARITDEDITKKGLIAKFNLEIDEKDNEIKELKTEINKINKELQSAKRGMALYSTDHEIKKKVLVLRSKNYSPTKIRDSLAYTGVDVEIEHIKNIVNNIEQLETEFRLHYKTCVEDYEKEIKINPQILRQASLDDIQFQIDKMKEMIDKAERDNEDTATIAKYMDKLDVYIKTRGTILKDVVFGEDEVGDNEQISKVKQSLERRNKRVMENFDTSKFKLVK